MERGSENREQLLVTQLWLHYIEIIKCLAVGAYGKDIEDRPVFQQSVPSFQRLSTNE